MTFSIHFIDYQILLIPKGITFAILDDDVDASVFHISPESIKTYIKMKDSDQLVLKNKAAEDKGNKYYYKNDKVQQRL